MTEDAPASKHEDLELDSSAADSEQIEDPSNEENIVQNVVGDQTSARESDIPLNKKPLDNEARLQQLETEHETLKSQYMRIAADFDNFRKRQSRDQDDLKLQLTCNTLSEILPIVDNFERARQQLNPEGEEAVSLHRNYQNLYKQLVDVLKKLGVAPMRVVGQSFDPTLHEALLREPSDTVLEDIIMEELVRGYHLNGRVLRHAQVKVSMGPGPQDEVVVESTDNASNSSVEENEQSSNAEA